jgi:energy-converting hydrogenase Eha subunit E
MAKFRFLRPQQWLYLGLHAVLLIIGALLAALGPGFLGGVGVALIATAIAGYTVFAYVLASDRLRAQLEVVQEMGIVSVFAVRSLLIREEYDRRLGKAHQAIDIMGFGLHTLLEDYRKEFEGWRDRAPVRILLIDPEFPDAAKSYASARDREESSTIGRIQQDVMDFVNGTEAARRARRGHPLHIRLFRCLPSINYFRVDDEAFWGPYLMNRPSRQNPTFVVRRGGQLFNLFAEHFEAIWSSQDLSRDVPATWLSTK